MANLLAFLCSYVVGYVIAIAIYELGKKLRRK